LRRRNRRGGLPEDHVVVNALSDSTNAHSLKRRVVREAGLVRAPGPVRDDPRPEGELFTFSYGAAELAWERWVFDSGPDELALAQLGPLLFVDETIWSTLGSALNPERGRLLVLPDLKGSTLNQVRRRIFTVTAMTAMIHCDFKGWHVVDVGAGDGLLSLVAAQGGAASIDLIDSDAQALELAVANLDRNRGSSLGIRVIHDDLRNTSGVLRQLTRTSRPTAILTSIGSWPEIYDVTNADAIRMVPLLEASAPAVRVRVELLLGAGYYLGEPWEEGGRRWSARVEAFFDDLAEVQRTGMETCGTTAKAKYNGVLFTEAWTATARSGGRAGSRSAGHEPTS